MQVGLHHQQRLKSVLAKCCWPSWLTGGSQEVKSYNSCRLKALHLSDLIVPIWNWKQKDKWYPTTRIPDSSPPSCSVTNNAHMWRYLGNQERHQSEQHFGQGFYDSEFKISALSRFLRTFLRQASLSPKRWSADAPLLSSTCLSARLFLFFWFVCYIFLAVQNSSIGDLVPWSVCLSGTTNNQSLHNTTEWT